MRLRYGVSHKIINYSPKTIFQNTPGKANYDSKWLFFWRKWISWIFEVESLTVRRYLKSKVSGRNDRCQTLLIEIGAYNYASQNPSPIQSKRTWGFDLDFPRIFRCPLMGALTVERSRIFKVYSFQKEEQVLKVIVSAIFTENHSQNCKPQILSPSHNIDTGLIVMVSRP